MVNVFVCLFYEDLQLQYKSNCNPQTVLGCYKYMKRAGMHLEVRRDRGRQTHKEVKMTGGGEGLVESEKSTDIFSLCCLSVIFH